MSESIIIILGIELVKYTNLSLMASIGIIKLAINETYKTDEILDIEKIRYFLKTSLSRHLKNLNLSNAEEIISNLENVAINNQSLLIMEAI